MRAALPCLILRKRMLVRFMAVALLSGCATTSRFADVPEDQYGWICQRNPQIVRGHLWINKELAADGQHRGYSVGWRVQRSAAVDSGGADIFWRVPASGDWHGGLDHATFDIAFDRQPVGPVEATLYLDGEIARREVLFDRRAVRSMRRSPNWGGSLFLTPSTLSPDQLHRARTARVIVTGPGGRRITQVELPMPDWTVVDRLVAEAIPALNADARDREEMCQRETGPEI